MKHINFSDFKNSFPAFKIHNLKNPLVSVIQNIPLSFTRRWKYWTFAGSQSHVSIFLEMKSHLQCNELIFLNSIHGGWIKNINNSLNIWQEFYQSWHDMWSVNPFLRTWKFFWRHKEITLKRLQTELPNLTKRKPVLRTSGWCCFCHYCVSLSTIVSWQDELLDIQTKEKHFSYI